MQTRPYPERDGLRIWLAREEQQRLLSATEDGEGYPRPRRYLALLLGLHGLRTDELLRVEPRHVRELATDDGYVLTVPSGKTGKRELPISQQLVDSIYNLKSSARLRADDQLVDVSDRQVRNWITDAREVLLEDEPDAATLGMHDLRRTWATDSYYSLALAGVPIAEQLVMSWGGWAQTKTGRETFVQNYLGPVPDHVTAEAAQHLPHLETSPLPQH